MTTTTSLGTSPATRASGGLRSAGLAVLLSAVLTGILLARNTNDGPAWRVSLVLAASVLAFTALVFGLVVRLALPPVFGGGIRDHRSQLKITS